MGPCLSRPTACPAPFSSHVTSQLPFQLSGPRAVPKVSLPPPLPGTTAPAPRPASLSPALQGLFPSTPAPCPLLLPSLAPAPPALSPPKLPLPLSHSPTAPTWLLPSNPTGLSPLPQPWSSSNPSPTSTRPGPLSPGATSQAALAFCLQPGGPRAVGIPHPTLRSTVFRLWPCLGDPRIWGLSLGSGLETALLPSSSWSWVSLCFRSEPLPHPCPHCPLLPGPGPRHRDNWDSGGREGPMRGGKVGGSDPPLSQPPESSPSQLAQPPAPSETLIRGSESE